MGFISSRALGQLDGVYSRLVHQTGIADRFFRDGFGDILPWLRVADGKAETPAGNWSTLPWPPAEPRIDLRPALPFTSGLRRMTGAVAFSGSFATTAGDALRPYVPAASLRARVEVLYPRVSSTSSPCPMVVQLAGTGDHGFVRRRTLAAPLLSAGVGTVILESPYYGDRRPRGQRGAKLRTVTDLLVLGRVTVEETHSLLTWLVRRGHTTLAVAGLSMGGVHAALAAATWRGESPVAAVPLLAPHSAGPAFLEGLLAETVDWGALDNHAAALNITGGGRPLLARALEVTDITRLPVPAAAVIVGARDDGYVPVSSVARLAAAWPDADLRLIGGGHVSSFMLNGPDFSRAILDALSMID